jgi:histidinol phosphatase-like enzyme (inositol monophosphatase family)
MSNPKENDPVNIRLAAAVEFVQEAGRLTLQYFQTDKVTVDRKSDNSPVTQADRGAELLLRERITKAFPDDSVIGEEFGEQTGSSGFTWIVDPIDGTKSFIGGVPLYSQLIGIIRENDSIAGVIHLPALDETVSAARGCGAWWRKGNSAPKPARVSTHTSLSQGIFLTSQVDSFDHRGSQEVFDELQRRAYVTRTWGDGYGYLLVATGRADVMVDPVMNVWDAAPLKPILEEAGGTFTDWQGEATIHHGEGIATNGPLLPEVLALTRKYPRR